MTLNELVALCKGEVIVSFNSQTVNYWTVKDEILTFELQHNYTYEDLERDVGKERLEKLFEGDFLCTVQYYPNTPVGFNRVYGLSLEDCLNQIEPW